MNSDMILGLKIEGGSFDLINRLVNGQRFTLFTFMHLEVSFSTPIVRTEIVEHPERDLGDEVQAACSEILEYRFFDLDESESEENFSVAEILYCPLEQIRILQDQIEVRTTEGVSTVARVCGFEFILDSLSRGSGPRGYRLIQIGSSDLLMFGDIDDANWKLPETLGVAKELKNS